MPTKLTDKQHQVLRYLSICTTPTTPTEIGEACGRVYYSASSWASGALKSLIAAGLVSAENRPYYSITDAGRLALSDSKENDRG